VAGSRLLIESAVHDAIVDRIVSRAQSIRLGNPLLEDTEMGPMASRAQLDRVLKYVEVGRREGAQLATGGAQPTIPKPGLFFEPTVFVDVRNDMTVARDEIFGPVLTVIPFRDEDEAVEIANDSEMGLAAGVWTNDLRRAHRMVRRLRVGTVWINSYRVASYEVPFGGYKMSGYGRENGMQGLREYLQSKAVWVELDGATRDPFKQG
jgi:aldehyde dehydrogenase (NAD+)